MSQGLKVAVSWSGGKDSCFSLYRAISSGSQPCFLLNMVNQDAKRSMSHGLDPKLIAAQAEAMEIPILQRETTWDAYEQQFKAAVAELKQKGVDGVVFGDIDLEEHKEWTERVCGELEIIPILPLWGNEPHTLLNDFIQVGFEAIIVSAKAEFFSDAWLGKQVSQEFIGEISRLYEKFNLHPCGEQGEYHTFVTNGPIFKRRIKIIDSHKVLREGYRFLDISRYELEGK